MKRFIAWTVSVLVVVSSSAVSGQKAPASEPWGVKLQSLPPNEVLMKLDLNRPGLEAVKAAVANGDQSRALSELLRYYRARFPLPPAAHTTTQPSLEVADNICRHVFQWGPYKPADYGANIDWTINPADDIEWVAAIYRFYWAEDLAKAYTATHDDKYARAFVELTTDWIAKHPLDDWTRAHPTLTYWKGFVWLDIQTGVRAKRAVEAFKAMVQSDAFTPRFLAIFLASMYDHQRKIEMVPLKAAHNKAVFEQRGVFTICEAFPEFADTSRWAKLAFDRVRETLLAQTTPEGVQREWCGSYHSAVTRDALDIMDKASKLGVTIPDDYRDRAREMCDYIFALTTPNLGWPMFGDTSRYEPSPKEPTLRFRELLADFSRVWNDPKYAARARMDEAALPKQMSYAFETAGSYVMRSQWSPAGTYLALHCPPPTISGHDQPDNGTFELFANGRWLLTDSGFYTYGHDKEARAWHRRTSVHQTLTLDNKDSKTDGRLRLWQSSPEFDALVVENPSYPGLVHRRTVWFVDKKFFVFLDEAIGQAAGALRVRWTPMPGTGRMSPDRTTYTTQFPDSNVLIHTASPSHAEFELEDGWYAPEYGQRTAREMLTVKSPAAAPAAFLTVVAPYAGTTSPEVQASLADGFTVGGDEARVSVRAFGKQWRVSRNLDKHTASCEVVENDRVASPAASAPAEVRDDRPAVDIQPAIRLGSDDHEDEFPAIGRDSGGNMWVCWVSYDGKADAVLAARIDGRNSSPPVVLSEPAGDHWRPAMGTDGKGRLWATWASNDHGKWDIWGKFLADGKWSDALRLTRGAGNNFCQKLSVDAAGTLWMAWQSVVDGNYEILLAPITPEGPAEPLNVSHHPASDWEPAIAATAPGHVYVAWDSYRGGSYDVLLAELKDGRLSEPVGIATTPAYEAHATLAVDRQDRLWIAWDNGGVQWGEDNKDGRKLHSERSVEVRCLAHGQLSEPAEAPSAALTGLLTPFEELPELSVDGSGRLWLFVRHVTDLTPKLKPGQDHVQDRGMWNPYALCYDGNRWSQPKPLPDSSGRNDMRVATCLDRQGRVWAAWADDGRTKARPPEPQNHNVHAAPVSMATSAAAMLETRSPSPTPPAPRGDEQSRASLAHHKLTVGGKEYVLAYGDTHRHTDISQCGMNHDGSLMDTYRYAIDVAKLDFLAITDHDQDILKHRAGRPKGPLQNYLWWRSEKYCDLFYIDHTFIPLYAYEHGRAAVQGGHKNVLYVNRGEACYEEDSPEALFKALQGKNAIAIPHQLADGGSATNWKKWNPEFERVAEVFQARGSYEFDGALPRVRISRAGFYYWDALAMGIHIGAIASSDHGMVHTAYAGVYCADLSRAGVMEGLKSRRTFGAMDRMAIDFKLGDRPLGQDVEVSGPPTFNVLIEAPKPLRKVQVVKNGQFVHTVEPGALTCRFDYLDRDIQPGQKAWYYVRCEQDDDRFGWSSPIWVDWKTDAAR